VQALTRREQTAHVVELPSDPDLLAADDAGLIRRHVGAVAAPPSIPTGSGRTDRGRRRRRGVPVHDGDEATLEWALSTRRLFLPLGVYGQRLSLAPEIPSTYIVAAHDRAIRPEWQRRMARERLGVEPLEIPSGHCPHVSRPDRLAELLADLAARYVWRGRRG
jgi:pimeloyl-ACP methyl ester carboxylesterase